MGRPNKWTYISLASRIWDRILFNHATGCWYWKGSVTKASGGGYGTAMMNGKTAYVHRILFSAMFGPIPEGLELDHLCRNRRCVNPNHLEAVTHSENLRRGWASRPRPTHCKRGHEMTPENTRSHESCGGAKRLCLICLRKRSAENMRKRRAMGKLQCSN